MRHESLSKQRSGPYLAKGHEANSAISGHPLSKTTRWERRNVRLKRETLTFPDPNLANATSTTCSGIDGQKKPSNSWPYREAELEATNKKSSRIKSNKQWTHPRRMKQLSLFSKLLPKWQTKLRWGNHIDSQFRPNSSHKYIKESDHLPFRSQNLHIGTRV